MKLLNFKHIFISLFILTCLSSYGQTNKINLQKSREKLQLEINRINADLKKNKKQKIGFQQQLELLQKKIKTRQSILDLIETDLRKTKQSITLQTEKKEIVGKQIDQLKSDFAKTLRAAQKQNSTPNNWLFILQAKNLHDAYKRYYYLKQYGDYRLQQKQNLVDKKEELQTLISNLEKEKNKQEKLKKESTSQKNELLADSKQLDEFLKTNKKAEQDLLAQIRKKIKERNAIDKKIALIIQKEREKRLAKNKPKKPGKKATAFVDLPQTKLKSKQFEKNKGLLPWPVSNGKVKHHFGKHRHPTLPNITQTFNGIEILTNKNQDVKSVFNGTVNYIFPLPNGTKCVVIRHGRYVSIYANLADVFVSEKEKIKTGATIGTVFGTSNKNAILNFQIWKENKSSEIKVDPESWLKRK
jgi:septal ring factor EnvC (AmiA/AmiB activator)